ncbi:hypothetical protein O9K51_11374 [Purpureocillium lavendulum]|uniref:Uncharacterized protein n=1 Tax=Purpureocillium lavendulum TaxID=1247861 RepID=A0AB34FB77_9HYPO|nr:hypothetical protein O9K51_11374 [Purpureocillium lavendulum]
MDLSPAQIDARNALRLHPKPRDRRAVLAGKEALRFRYETKEFFDVDVTTFVDLYARLPPSGLARVALAPDVINNSGRSEDVFNAYWDELYADTRSEEPLLAALFLVEVAEYGIQQISRSGPEASVIANFTRQVSRLKKVLCNSKAMMSRKRPHAEISRQEDSSLSAVHNRHTKKQRRKRKTGHVMEAGQICPGNHPSDPLAEQCAIKEGIHGLRGAGSNAEKHEYDEKHPGTEVRGYDLGLCQPSAVPPNVEFIVDDVEKDWLDTNQYDYIHLRSLTGIRDWPRLLRQIYDNLHPGGWVELQGFLSQPYSEDGTLLPGNPLVQLMDGLRQAGDKCGRTMDPAASFRQLAESAKFENVEEQRFPLPVGSWAEDPTLNEIGKYMALSFHRGVEGMTVAPLRDVLGWSREAVDELNTMVREAISRQDIHAVFDFVVVTGRKLVA